VNGKEQTFSFLSDAVKAYDDHIVHTYGKQTKRTQHESDSDSSSNDH